MNDDLLCVPLQVEGYHCKNGMVSTVAKLLAIGADAALVDRVLACLFMNVNTLGD
jgi:hypothetical protein